MGYLVVTAVLVVTFGRLGDMYGRVRMYNAGFLIFTIASILLSLTPFTGSQGALWLIGFRVVQGVGGALLLANSTAILTDAFPADPAGHGAWASTWSPPSPGRSSAWSSAGCSPTSTGASSSG